MKVELWVVGKTTFEYLEEGVNIYIKRLKHYVSFSMRVFPDVKKSKRYSKSELKQLEGASVLKVLQKQDFLILLDENGQQLSSEGFSSFLEKKRLKKLKIHRNG